MNQTYFVLTPDGIYKKFLSGALTKEEAIQDYMDKTDGEIPKGTLMVEEKDIDSWTWNPVKKIWESKRSFAGNGQQGRFYNVPSSALLRMGFISRSSC